MDHHSSDIEIRLLLTMHCVITMKIDHFLLPGRGGFGSDTHEYEFVCHYLPHFILNSDMNTNIVEYEYKTDISFSDSHSNTYSIYSIES
jgi:hypothetical protein